MAEDADEWLDLVREAAGSKTRSGVSGQKTQNPDDAEWAEVAKAKPPEPARLAGTDAGPNARRAAAGKPRDPTLDATLENTSEPIRGSIAADVFGMAHTPEEAAQRRAQRPADPMEVDPIAQGVVAGTVAGPLARLAVPALEATGAPAVAVRAGEGAIAGATASKLQGGDALPGAVLGGVLGAIPGPKPRAPIDETAAAYREFGRKATENTAAKLQAIGPDAVRRVLRKFEVGRVSEPVKARAAIIDGRKAAGAEMGAKFDEVQKLGGEIDMGAVAKGLDDLQAKFGKTTGTEAFAENVADLRGKLLKKYGTKGTVTPAELNAEVSAIEKGAYGGNYSNPGTAKTVQRQTSRALDAVLDAHLDAVASKPGGAEAVKALREATQDFRVLSTLEPIATKASRRAEFAETATETLKRDPAGAVKAGAAKVATAPLRAAVAAGRGTMAAGEAAARAAATPEARAAMSAQIAESLPVWQAVAGGDDDAAKRHLARLVVGE